MKIGHTDGCCAKDRDCFKGRCLVDVGQLPLWSRLMFFDLASLFLGKCAIHQQIMGVRSNTIRLQSEDPVQDDNFSLTCGLLKVMPSVARR
jgi:hypothetical protein